MVTGFMPLTYTIACLQPHSSREVFLSFTSFFIAPTSPLIWAAYSADVLPRGVKPCSGLVISVAVGLRTDTYAAQFSSRIPGTRANSLVSLVTRMVFDAKAWAAIKVSKAPMGCPRRSNEDRTPTVPA